MAPPLVPRKSLVPLYLKAVTNRVQVWLFFTENGKIEYPTHVPSYGVAVEVISLNVELVYKNVFVIELPFIATLLPCFA